MKSNEEEFKELLSTVHKQNTAILENLKKESSDYHGGDEDKDW